MEGKRARLMREGIGGGGGAKERGKRERATIDDPCNLASRLRVNRD